MVGIFVFTEILFNQVNVLNFCYIGEDRQGKYLGGKHGKIENVQNIDVQCSH